MSNIAQNIGALNIKELEARQEQLHDELRQIQKQIEVAQQAEITIREAVAAVQKCQRRIEEFAPTAKQEMWEAILSCKDEFLLTPQGQWENQQPRLTKEEQRSAFDEGHLPITPDNFELIAPPPKEETTEAKELEIEENDEAFEEYIDNPAQPEIDISQVAIELVEGQTTEQLNTRPYAEFINLTPKVGYLRRIDDGAILGAYLGGKNKSLLEVWAKRIAEASLTYGMKCEHEVRTAQRLKDSKYEIKFKHISFSVLEALTRLDTSKSPKFNGSDILPVLSVNKPGAVVVEAKDSDGAAESAEDTLMPLGVGDRVLIKTDRHGEEFVDQVGIVSVSTKTGAAINVGGALKYFHAEEISVVERSAEIRNPADDLAASASAPLDLTDDAVPW